MLRSVYGLFDCNISTYGQREITLSLTLSAFLFMFAVLYSQILNSNSRNMFNYSSIHPTYNVYFTKTGPGISNQDPKSFTLCRNDKIIL